MSGWLPCMLTRTCATGWASWAVAWRRPDWATGTRDFAATFAAASTAHGGARQEQGRLLWAAPRARTLKRRVVWYMYRMYGAERGDLRLNQILGLAPHPRPRLLAGPARGWSHDLLYSCLYNYSCTKVVQL